MNTAVDELGIGLMCFPGLESVVQSFSGYIDVVETEPQASWFKESPESDSFCFEPLFANFLANLPQPKIFHGVGFPVGGTFLPCRDHFETLNAHIRAVRPTYISEHLSFNKFCNMDGEINHTNFLLPPLQNEHGIQTAVRAIRQYKNQTSLPFAFETGCNYLQPRKGEMEDGEFVARIAEESDTYILLDLHNLMANEWNGRQQVKDFVAQLPPERIIEIHLAGGFFFNDYYLDAHSAISSGELLSLAHSIIEDLPCLKSIVFEMRPDPAGERSLSREESGNTLSENNIKKQLIEMNRLWDQRNKRSRNNRSYQRSRSSSPVDNTLIPEVWEYALGNVVTGQEDETHPLQYELMQDQGTEIIRDLLAGVQPSPQTMPALLT